jgi:hypothetical protein
MDERTWDEVLALLARGWTLAVASPEQRTEQLVRVETPTATNLVGAPFAVFYTADRSVWSRGETVAEAIRKATAELGR